MHLGIRIGIGAVALATPTIMTLGWVSAAEERLAQVEAEVAGTDEPKVAVAAAANAEYCNANLKKVLRKVLLSCGLADNANARGCQPVDAKAVATMSGEDFNTLFLPLAERASIIQFDKNKANLEERDVKVLDETYNDQRGASWFFVVARSSPDGTPERNRELSQQRADAVMNHLREKFDDPDLDKEVGLLWLGEEFAQLDDRFCQWKRSDAPDPCEPTDINRSAFVAWIDCRL